MKNNKKEFRSSTTVKLPNGESKRIFARGKSEKEVQKKLAEIKTQYEMGMIVANSNTTFKMWSAEWLEVYKKPNVTQGWYKDLCHIIDKWYLPTLGNMKISEIKLIHIQNCLNEMQGMSWNYVDRSTVAIKECFRKAVENDLIIKNPTMGLIKPKATKGTRRALTEEEISLFKKVAEKHIHGDIFAIMLACGLRPGEARALTWFNVDLKNKLLFVQQAVENHSNNIKEPKTSAGIRTVPIPDWYMSYLLGKNKSQSMFVFPNTLGNILDATAIRRAWDSFRRQMDLEAGAETYRNKIIIHKIDQNISPYYLRHTFATKCIEKGVDPRTLQHLMGHENISTTMKYYTHVTPKMLDDARKKINVI